MDIKSLVDEVKLLQKEIRKLRNEKPDIEKYESHYDVLIADATKQVREIRRFIKSLDLKGRRRA